MYTDNWRAVFHEVWRIRNRIAQFSVEEVQAWSIGVHSKRVISYVFPTVYL
jgi:hypothetical protein